MKFVLLSLIALAALGITACGESGYNGGIAKTPLECQTAHYINGNYYNSNNRRIDCSNFYHIGSNFGFIPYNGNCPSNYYPLYMGSRWQCAPAKFYNYYGINVSSGIRYMFYPSWSHYSYSSSWRGPKRKTSTKSTQRNCGKETLIGAVAGGAAGTAVGNNMGSHGNNGAIGGTVGALAGSMIGQAQCN